MDPAPDAQQRERNSIVHVISHRAKVPTDGVVVDTTSNSTELWSRGLSPFYLGPVDLYDGYVAQNVENGFQFSKTYAQHATADNKPTEAYFEWAKKGWAAPAKRYPMGRGAIPLGAWWKVGEEYRLLGYIEARKRIYCKLYSTAVEVAPAWEQLREIHRNCERTGAKLYLRDYDGYDRRRTKKTYHDVLNDPAKKMGHAFVLAMMLDNCRVWEAEL